MDDAVRHARRLAADGADFIDIGAQSTRPGATRLSTDEELSRLLPVLDALARDPALDGVDLSVDTFDSRFDLTCSSTFRKCFSTSHNI